MAREEQLVLAEEWPEDYDLDYDDYTPRRRRRNPRSTATTAIGSSTLIVVIAVVGWLIWFRNKNGRWPWQSAPKPLPTTEAIRRVAAGTGTTVNKRSGIGFRSIPTIPENLNDLSLTIIEP